MTIDIKDFYLNTPMPRYKYLRLKLEDLPKDFTKNTTSETKSQKLDTSLLRFVKEYMD